MSGIELFGRGTLRVRLTRAGIARWVDVAGLERVTACGEFDGGPTVVEHAPTDVAGMLVQELDPGPRYRIGLLFSRADIGTMYALFDGRTEPQPKEPTRLNRAAYLELQNAGLLSARRSAFAAVRIESMADDWGRHFDLELPQLRLRPPTLVFNADGSLRTLYLCALADYDLEDFRADPWLGYCGKVRPVGAPTTLATPASAT